MQDAARKLVAQHEQSLRVQELQFKSLLSKQPDLKIKKQKNEFQSLPLL
jgi:hypothetical protein